MLELGLGLGLERFFERRSWDRIKVRVRVKIRVRGRGRVKVRVRVRVEG